MQALPFIFISVLLNVGGQITLKYGVKTLGVLHLSLPELFRVFTNLNVLLGLVLYGLSFVFWIVALSKTDLSFAYPFLSLGYILILVWSYFIFQENISIVRVAGILLIVVGLICVARS